MTSGLARGNALTEMLAGIRVRILDRYMISELGGPFSFGLSAFTLIFAATQILAISRLVSDRHAPLAAVIAYFLWQLPGIVVLVIPMAMLLGMLLALQRLSGESEITALKAGGVSLTRVVAPLLGVGLVVSVLALFLQEGIVPYANDRANYLREETIEHIGLFGSGSQAVTTKLPNGGRQLTIVLELRGVDAGPGQRDADSIRSREPAGRHRVQSARALRAADLDVRKRDRVSLRLRRDDLDADRAVAAVGHRVEAVADHAARGGR